MHNQVTLAEGKTISTTSTTVFSVFSLSFEFFLLLTINLPKSQLSNQSAFLLAMIKYSHIALTVIKHLHIHYCILFSLKISMKGKTSSFIVITIFLDDNSEVQWPPVTVSILVQLVNAKTWCLFIAKATVYIFFILSCLLFSHYLLKSSTEGKNKNNNNNNKNCPAPDRMGNCNNSET